MGSAARRRGRPPIDEVGEGERREEILRAASDLFERRGYAAVSLAEVAAAVGVTKAALYHHFPGKADLYAAVMVRALTLKAEMIARAARGDGPFVETLRRLTEFPIVFLKEEIDMDAMMRDVAEHLSVAQRREIDAADRRRLEAVEELMREGAARGELRDDIDPKVLAHAYWHLLSGFVGRARGTAGIPGDAATAKSVADLFLRGAGTQRDGRTAVEPHGNG